MVQNSFRSETPETKVTVYYDGLCPLCSREIDHYRKQNGCENLIFMDITSPSFKAESEGLDPFAIHRVMHIKTGAGELRTGVDAFIAIWDVLPNYHWLANLAKRPTLRPIMDIGYQGFAWIRPYLPRRRREAALCEESPFCEVKK
jgi:predicted DCC family thiol-disulfide oxidoreductase YuxK